MKALFFIEWKRNRIMKTVAFLGFSFVIARLLTQSRPISDFWTSGFYFIIMMNQFNYTHSDVSFMLPIKKTTRLIFSAMNALIIALVSIGIITFFASVLNRSIESGFELLFYAYCIWIVSFVIQTLPIGVSDNRKRVFIYWLVVLLLSIFVIATAVEGIDAIDARYRAIVISASTLGAGFIGANIYFGAKWGYDYYSA